MRDTGYKISEETIAFIQPGVTTRAEVIENLGPPLMELPDIGVVAYSWGKLRATAGRARMAEPSMPGRRMGYAVAPEAPEESGLVEAQRWICCIASDPTGRVQRVERVKLEEQGVSLEQAVRQWAREGSRP
jgi:hypothetical protein